MTDINEVGFFLNNFTCPLLKQWTSVAWDDSDDQTNKGFRAQTNIDFQLY